MSFTTAPSTTPPALRRLLAAAVTCGVVASSALLPVTASAAPPEVPTILGPDSSGGTPLDGSPELQWAFLPDATGYEAQIDNDPTFASPEYKVSTVNTVAVVDKALDAGTQHLRVRARNAAGEWSAWATSEFVVTRTAGPVLTAPADHDPAWQGTGARPGFLPQPGEPPVLRWNPVPGATSYTVEIATEPEFISPTRVTTTSSAYVVPNLQAPDVEYHWRVRATLADKIFSEWSWTRSYVLGALDRPTLVAPLDGERIQEVVLEWAPVAGASRYDLQISTDEDFQTFAHRATNLVSTRYSPATTIGNGDYYWRVRALDADGNASAWSHAIPRVVGTSPGGEPELSPVELSEPAEFTRDWREAPQLLHPEDTTGQSNVPVGDDFYYQWAPVPLASRYQLYVSTDPTFSSVKACATTSATTYVPTKDTCLPKSEGTRYYWYVVALDSPSNVPSLRSEIHSFVYSPEAFTFLNPAGLGAELSRPTIEWEAMQGVESYSVSIYRGETRLTGTTTRSTSWTPAGELDVDPTDALHVRISATRRSGAQTPVQRSDSFFFAPDKFSSALAPGEPSQPAPSVQAPQLEWGQVPDAAHYRIRVRNTANDVWFIDSSTDITNTKWTYTSATSASTAFSAPGVYEWYVRAFDADGDVIFDGYQTAHSTFEILEPAAVQGQQVAVSGLAADAGNVCDKNLDRSRTDWCDGLPTTPVLDWEPTPEANYYKVWVSRDSDFTSGIVYGGVETANTRWIPTDALPDSEAGAAYYWFVQACANGVCSPSPAKVVDPAKHAFRKTSPKVELLTPAQSDVVDTRQVTFRWTDYLTTNLTHEHQHRNSAAAQPAPATPSPEYSDQAARAYEIQISQHPEFRTILDSDTVDQTTYTSPSKIYPEGELYWRVQALDGNGNKLGWASAPRSFTKKSPTVTGLSPRGGAVHASAHAEMVWDHLPLSQAYNLQIAAVRTGEISPVADNNFNETTLKVRATNLKRNRYTGTAGTIVPPSAAGETYLWRVQQVMAGGSLGPWSEPEQFVVRATAPEQVSPAQDGVVGPRSAVLRWLRIDGAAQYRVALRQVGTTSTTTVTTKGIAWAVPTALKASTAYEWRVEALDASNRAVGTSAWTQVKVAGPPAVVTPPRITGDLVLGGRLDVVAPVWDDPAVTNSYEWRRNGRAIAGANLPTYTIGVTDVGATITVVVTGTSAEAGSSSVTSSGVAPAAGPGPVVASAPVLPSKVVVGREVVPVAPVWVDEEVTVKWQWLRDGKSISRATKSTYTPTRSDVGTLLQLRATGTLPGRVATVTLSAPVGVWATTSTPPTRVPPTGGGSGTGTTPPAAAKKNTTTKISTPKKLRLKGKKRTKAKITVTVRTADGKAARGKVVLRVKGKKIGTGTLKANGKVKITTKALKRGTHRITARYAGTATTKASTSKAVKLRVVK